MQRRGVKTIVYDSGLHLEAYRFQGFSQPFPSHFHAYYVIGLVEQGRRKLFCRDREYELNPGDILLFQPGDSHACVQQEETLDYRGLNLAPEVMARLALEAAGTGEPVQFTSPVISEPELAQRLRHVHSLMMADSPGTELEKEEGLLLLLAQLIRRFGQEAGPPPACPEEIEAACAFIQEHYAQRLSLEQICRHAGLSKSSLLRGFARSKGVTPYRYLENIRVARARELLEQGVPPAQAALDAGFSDQSHFTGYFSRFTGLSPGLYQGIFGESKPEEGAPDGNDAPRP